MWWSREGSPSINWMPSYKDIFLLKLSAVHACFHARLRPPRSPLHTYLEVQLLTQQVVKTFMWTSLNVDYAIDNRFAFHLFVNFVSCCMLLCCIIHPKHHVSRGRGGRAQVLSHSMPHKRPAFHITAIVVGAWILFPRSSACPQSVLLQPWLVDFP